VNKRNEFIVFILDEQKIALHLSAVDRVVMAAEITTLPKAPDIVLGIINVGGKIIPVVNTRKRFRLPDREMHLTDQFIMAHAARRTVALLVDTVTDIIETAPQEMIAAAEVFPNLEYVEGVVKLKDGLILIHNLDTFLSLEEETALEEAIKKQQADKVNSI